MQKSLLVSAFVAAFAAPGVLVAQQSGTPTAPAQPPTTDTLVTRSANGDVEQGDVLAVAKNAGNFTVLLRAIEAAGLAETLQGDGPFTLFAPTDEAFAKLPQATLDELAAKPRKLRRVLKYHVVGARAEGGRRRRAAVDPDARRPEDQGPGPRGRPRAQPLRQGRPGRQRGQQRHDPRDRPCLLPPRRR